jgi:hypothetical protein
MPHRTVRRKTPGQAARGLVGPGKTRGRIASTIARSRRTGLGTISPRGGTTTLKPKRRRPKE